MAPTLSPAERVCPWARRSRNPAAERDWDGHGCNLPGDTGEQHAALKDLKVLLLLANSDLNLMDKHK